MSKSTLLFEPGARHELPPDVELEVDTQPQMVSQARLQASPTEARLAVLEQGSRAWLLLPVLLILVMGLHLATLLRYPTPFVDEGWNASRAWGLLHTGRAFGTLDAGVFEHYDGYWTFFPWLGTAIHALFMYLLGPSLFAVRLASLAFGGALLVAVYSIGNRLYGSRVGLLGAGLLSLSPSFFVSAHMARHDVIVAALGFGAVALYITDGPNESRVTLKSLLCGVAASLTLDIHYYGVIYAPAIMCLYLIDYRWGTPKSKRFWGFVAGLCAGIGFFAAMHILPYPGTFFALYSLGNGSSHTPPLLTSGPLAWLGSLGDTLLLLGAPMCLLVIGSAALLLRRRSAQGLRLLVLFGVLVLMFSLAVRSKNFSYIILIYPAACLLAAVLIARLFERDWHASLWSFTRAALATGLAVATLIPGFIALQEDSSSEYQAVLTRIQRAVPPASQVIGTQTFWFALPDQTYLSWEQIIFYMRNTPGSTVEDAFKELHPDFFIRDGWIDLFVTDDPARLARSNDDSVIPKAQLEKFLNERSRLVDSVSTSEFGDVRVYKIDWSARSGVPGSSLGHR